MSWMPARRRSLAIGLALTLCHTLAAAAENFPGIRVLMSPEEFRAAGLERLTPEELEALDRWLVRFTAQDPDPLQRDSEAVGQAQHDIVVRANIIGDFSGWSGETVFELNNGQVWRQRHKDNFNYTGADRAVEIRKNLLGFYKMTHLASGNSVGVSRVK